MKTRTHARTLDIFTPNNCKRMPFFKSMLNDNLKQGSAPDNNPNEYTKDTDMLATDLLDGGHKLTALENDGSSLTTVWSSCGLRIECSTDNVKVQTDQNSETNSQ
ncbi:uncharacterized protein LOC116805616 isoform X2 [Drosophila grimshawi]|uniref:uncharacterized protein LOC116805616 isoform X2 n=1 Tax=Drosophila grimshawi TaxID=7222 RepID=UPI000C86F5A2|nr:uncharacterized protein LOC116805616 isoform X2 [Drosophila grimshawi]